MERLCDILNAKIQQPDTDELEKTNPAWEFIKDFFSCNTASCKKIKMSFKIKRNELIVISLDGLEYDSNLDKTDVLDCVRIAKSHGLGVSKDDLDPKDPVCKEDIECSITFSFTPSNITDL